MEVTGYTKSRLVELKKYTFSDVFTQMYISSTSLNIDGVDYRYSTENNVMYYLGKIKFNDIIDSNGVTTKFSYFSVGLDNNTSDNLLLYKDNKKEGIISKPKIKNDVFIIRQESNIFDRISKLNWVYDMKKLNSYAGGNYFVIKRNT
jgi:hypothetical protein